MSCKNAKCKLLSGNEMPLIGFGTFQIRGKELIKTCLDYALGAGYKLIDTAAVYGNEADIGLALKELLPKYNLQRKDIYITSKLSPSDQGDAAYSAVETSLRNLQCDYLDLYLIHWPGVSGIASSSDANAQIRAKSWAALVKAKEKGLVRDIGVSNYTVRHLQELLKNSFGVKPAVNQVEWHPHYHDLKLKEFCEKEGIILQAYSSLGGSNNAKLLNDAQVVAIASKLGKSKAQVLLRWATQQNIAIIPKARTQEHIQQNIDLDFVIPKDAMDVLSSKMETYEKYAWDPEVIA